tara:strand:- start:154 stop:327 length:174 start_codon:yes stop_codon:yes gene_type:complete
MNRSWDCSIDYLRTKDNNKEYYSAKLFMQKERREAILTSIITVFIITVFIIYKLFIN